MTRLSRVVRCKSWKDEAIFINIDNRIVWTRCLPCDTGGSFAVSNGTGDSERMQELKRIAVEKTRGQQPIGDRVLQDGTFNPGVPFDHFYLD